MIEKRWLVVLCKKPGDASTPPPAIDIYRKFNRRGGIRQYWREATQGVLDLSFVTTQDWLDVNFDLTGYPGPGNSMRGTFFNACVQAARDKGYPVDETAGIVAFVHAPFDLWGSKGQVVCDIQSDHNDICHEVGHGVGLNHTWGATSPALLAKEHSIHGRSPYTFLPGQYDAEEYGDLADVMSVNNVWGKEERGPLLCGPNLFALTAGLGEVRPEKIEVFPNGERKVTARLAPLYGPGGPDPNLVSIVIQRGAEGYEYFFELRMTESWDKGLPQPGILVHELRPDGTVVRLYPDDKTDPDLWPGGLVLLHNGMWEPPMQRGGELVDAPRLLRVKVLEMDLNQRYTTFEIEVGADPFPFEQRFRAVNSWAAERNFIGAFPNFHDAPYGPGWEYPAILLKPEAIEWRDIPAAELGNPDSFEARFRAVNNWAASRGYVSAFPNFHQADYGQGMVYGTLLVKQGFAEWRDVPASDLGEPGTPEALFKAVNDYAQRQDFLGAFPNHHYAAYGVEYETLLIKPGMADWRDIPAAELGNPATPEARFRAVNNWASQNGYLSAFPNFHQADYGNGMVYGAILIKYEAADWRDIPAADLDNPGSFEARFQAMNNWATDHGYAGAFPNFHQADYGQGTVYGTILIKAQAADRRDLRASELGNPAAPEDRFRAVNNWAAIHGYVSAFPSFKEVNHGTVYGTILIHKTAGDKLTYQAAELNYPLDREARFRAIQGEADRLGLRGGFPTFQDADRGRGSVFGTILLKENAVVHRDIPAADLGNPQTPEARFRAVNNWAIQNGYLSAFPNFFEADYGQGTVYGTLLLKREAADWRDIRAAELGDPQTREARFRAVNNWAAERGYVSAFPNFHEAYYGLVYGTILIRQGFADWQDIPAADLGNPATFEARFRAVNNWAHEHGYLSAFPNFHEANYGNGLVYGTILIKNSAADWRDLLVGELGNPITLQERFRAVNNWAIGHGYLSGFPNFHEAVYPRGRVYGTILIKREAADWRDLRAVELGNPATPEDRFRAVNNWAATNGYVSAYPNFHEANFGTVYGTLLIRPGYAEWRDVPVSQLVFR